MQNECVGSLYILCFCAPFSPTPLATSQECRTSDDDMVQVQAKKSDVLNYYHSSNHPIFHVILGLMLSLGAVIPIYHLPNVSPLCLFYRNVGVLVYSFCNFMQIAKYYSSTIFIPIEDMIFP